MLEKEPVNETKQGRSKAPYQLNFLTHSTKTVRLFLQYREDRELLKAEMEKEQLLDLYQLSLHVEDEELGKYCVTLLKEKLSSDDFATVLTRFGVPDKDPLIQLISQRFSPPQISEPTEEKVSEEAKGNSETDSDPAQSSDEG